MRGGAAGGAAVLALVALLAVAGGDRRGSPEPVATATGAPEDAVVTTLVFGTRERDTRSQTPAWIALLSLDKEAQRGAVVYIPAHTAVEVPGRGLQPLGGALDSGGVPLLLVAAENLLGVTIDRYVELSDNDARVLLSSLGPLSVDVPTDVRVPVGKRQARLIFAKGPQRLSAPFLVRLLYTLGLDADEVELGFRHLAFWDSLFESYADASGDLRRRVEEAGAALAESDVAPEQHAELLAALAALPAADLTVTALPVSQALPRSVAPGGEELYEADRDEIAQFITETLGAAALASDEVRVQILNGNGAPGIGQEVAKRLVGEGYRVILSGNARRLNYPRTLIITYDSGPEALALADEARELIGVGRVQVSGQDQGIVDLTIVVGRDFLETL